MFIPAGTFISHSRVICLEYLHISRAFYLNLAPVPCKELARWGPWSILWRLDKRNKKNCPQDTSVVKTKQDFKVKGKKVDSKFLKSHLPQFRILALDQSSISAVFQIVWFPSAPKSALLEGLLFFLSSSNRNMICKIFKLH